MPQNRTVSLRDCACQLAEALLAQGMTAHALAWDDGTPGVHVEPASAPSVGFDLRCQRTATGWHYVTPSGVGIATVEEAVEFVLYLYGRPRR